MAGVPNEALRIEKSVYGGSGLAHTAGGEVAFVPFAWPGELVELPVAGTPGELKILQASPDRVEPRCVHFGICGGCQYQMAGYGAQLAIKQAILQETLQRAGVPPGLNTVGVQVWGSPEEYGYRNRVRLRVRRVEGALRLGYSVRGTSQFLPVTMCPISAPLLWRAAEALMRLATNRELAAWMDATAELELFCDAQETRLQVNLLCTGKPPRGEDAFGRLMKALQALVPELVGAGAARLEPRSGRAVESLAAWGAAGLAYAVEGELYWVARGGFFQVNRFLLARLVELVCGSRSGALAWDLFAGVGLFSRVLARRFENVTAVEANPVAAGDLGRSLAKMGAQHRAVQATTLEFLRRAVLERDRPELILLDPPRAGAGPEACHLLARLAPEEVRYLSCDPTTLARDLVVLTGAGYRLAELHLIDLFPQTYHLETLAVLGRA